MFAAVSPTVLHAQDLRLRDLIDAVPVAMALGRIDGSALYLNRKFTELFGFTLQDLPNIEAWWMHAYPDAAYRGTVQDKWRQCLDATDPRTGEIPRFESQVVCRDRSTRVIEFRARRIGDDVAIAFEDRTERDAAERSARDHAELLNRTLDAILVADADRHVRYANQRAAALFNRTTEQLLTLRLDDLLFPGAPESAEAAARRATEDGSHSVELTFTEGINRGRVVESRWMCVRREDNAPERLLVVITDITERKQLEARFLRAQRLETIGTLASGIAHDLNNVFAPITMSLNLLKSIAPTQADEELVTLLNLSAQRGTSIVRQLLTLGRGAGGQRQEIQPRSLLREIAAIVTETFPRSIQFKYHFTPELWPVRADSTQIHQSLLNLCVNARDAMPHGGTLALTAENVLVEPAMCVGDPDARPGPYVVVSVSDTGSGIAPEVMPHIFEPFFTTKDPGQGSGLGLPTTLAIVRSHGGFLRFTSGDGRGTMFKLYFPAAGTQALEVPEAPTTPIARGQGETILVVDDDEIGRNVAVTILTATGYQVRAASSGSEALFLYSREPSAIHAVLTDLSMPMMDGPSLIRALRRRDHQLPIIAMSGLPRDEHERGGFRLPISGFISKPFTHEQLAGLLRQVLTTSIST